MPCFVELVVLLVSLDEAPEAYQYVLKKIIFR
jgi:hypothetical protein